MLTVRGRYIGQRDNMAVCYKPCFYWLLFQMHELCWKATVQMVVSFWSNWLTIGRYKMDFSLIKWLLSAVVPVGERNFHDKEYFQVK